MGLWRVRIDRRTLDPQNCPRFSRSDHEHSRAHTAETVKVVKESCVGSWGRKLGHDPMLELGGETK